MVFVNHANNSSITMCSGTPPCAHAHPYFKKYYTYLRFATTDAIRSKNECDFLETKFVEYSSQEELKYHLLSSVRGSQGFYEGAVAQE